MKRTLMLVLSSVMALFLVACGDNAEKKVESTSTEQVQDPNSGATSTTDTSTTTTVTTPTDDSAVPADATVAPADSTTVPADATTTTTTVPADSNATAPANN